MRLNFLIVFLLSFAVNINAQHSTNHLNDSSRHPKKVSRIHATTKQTTSWLIPIAGIGYGLSSLYNNTVHTWDLEIQKSVAETNPSAHTRLDDYLALMPAFIVAGKSIIQDTRENQIDLAGTFACTKIIQYGLVMPTKRWSGKTRPDGSDQLSFPSGHTAEAFANAEILRIHVGKKSPWLAAGGYLIAITTGYLRMYNNRHWLSDVVAGAAIGFGSARLGSWGFQKIKPKIFPRKNKLQLVYTPTRF